MIGKFVIRHARTSSRLGLLAAAAVTAMALAPAVFAAAPATPSPTGSDPRLDGTWVITAAEREQLPYPDIVGAKVTFKGGMFTIERTEGRSKWFGDLKADAKTGAIDMLMQADTAVFPLKGEKWEGLYRFNGDQLEINTSQGHDWRPSEFVTGYDLADLKLKKQ